MCGRIAVEVASWYLQSSSSNNRVSWSSHNSALVNKEILNQTNKSQYNSHKKKFLFENVDVFEGCRNLLQTTNITFSRRIGKEMCPKHVTATRVYSGSDVMVVLFNYEVIWRQYLACWLLTALDQMRKWMMNRKAFEMTLRWSISCGFFLHKIITSSRNVGHQSVSAAKSHS